MQAAYSLSLSCTDMFCLVSHDPSIRQVGHWSASDHHDVMPAFAYHGRVPKQQE